VITDYKNKGPGKRFGKYINLNITERMYKDLNEVSSKNEETMAELMRRGIAKEIERSK